MPFPKWAVEPVFLSRKLPPDKSEPGNFYPATHAALVNSLKQLASVVKIADQIFDEIGCECRLLAERSERLKDKITSCHEVVSKLNARAVKVPVSDLSETARVLRRERPYATKYEQSSQFFLPSTRPPCIDRLYGNACTTPVAVICTIDRYRTDGLSSSELFMVTPVLGGTRKKRRKLLDIETRKPANFSLTRTYDQIDSGSSSLPPLVSPSRGYILKQNENLELERLPSPEEQAMLVSLEYPSIVVPVDTSGASFTRMSLLRRSLIHADFTIKRKKSKKKSKRRHTFCEGDNRELEQAIRNVTNSSCQTDDTMDSTTSIHRSLSRRRSKSVQDNFRRKTGILDELDLDSLKQDSKDSATEDDKDKSPTKTLSTNPKKSKTSSLRSRASNFNPISSLSAAISIAAVKMRSRGSCKQDDGRSSSGNWSASSSTRASVDSDHQQGVSPVDGVSSPSRNSVGKDSVLSDATHVDMHNRSRDDILPIQSLSCSPVKKKKFGTNLNLPWEVNNGRISNTPTPDFTSMGSSSTPVIRSPCAGRRGVSDDGDSSVYSVDTDGYYTSMHTDSGLWCNALNTLRKEDVMSDLVDFRQRKESQSSVSTIDNSSINSFLSKSATECSSNSDSLKGMGCPEPPPRVSSVKPISGYESKAILSKADQEVDSSDKSYSPHAHNGSTSESEFEVRDRIRLKTAITANRYPSMCAVSPETSDDEIADLKRRTNVNVVVAEIHQEEKLFCGININESNQFRDTKTENVQVVPKPITSSSPSSRLHNYPSAINMYRSETPVPSTFASSVCQNQMIRTSTPKPGVNVTTFSSDINDNIATSKKTSTLDTRNNNTYELNQNSNEIFVTEKPISLVQQSDKTLIPLKYAQRITVTPIARSDSSTISNTGTIKRIPLKQLSLTECRNDKASLSADKIPALMQNKSDGSPSYVSFKAPDSPISSVSSFKLGSSEGKISSPTSSLTRPVARVTLDPTGKVVYSSNSLERPSTVGLNKNAISKRPYATLPKYEANSGGVKSSIPIREVQNDTLLHQSSLSKIENNPSILQMQTDGYNKLSTTTNTVQSSPQSVPSNVHQSLPNQNFSFFKSGKDFTFRPSRGGRFCRSYFPSHLISAPSNQSVRVDHQPESPSSSTSVVVHNVKPPLPQYYSNEHSAGQKYPKTTSHLPSFSRTVGSPQKQQPVPSCHSSPSNYVPNSLGNTIQGPKQFYTTPNSNIWPGRCQSSSVTNRYVSSNPQSKMAVNRSLISSSASISDNPKTNCNSMLPLSPPDLIPSGESPPSTLDVTSSASSHKKFVSESRNQSDNYGNDSGLLSGTDTKNLKALSANELFAIIHSSKKKLNIKTESEKSMSPMSSRSVSPALSQNSVSKLQPIETGVLSRRYDNSPDRSKWCNSMPSSIGKRSNIQEKLGGAKPTSMRDFKMLLLQTRTGSQDSSPRPSAAELLKISPPKTSASGDISKLPLPSSLKTPPASAGNYSPAHGTIPMKRNLRTRSPYLTRYDSAYPPIIEDCSEEMESYEDSNTLNYKTQKFIKKHEMTPQPSATVTKATSTWV